MRKPITRMQHGIADWLLIPLVAASPFVLGFANSAVPRQAAFVAAGAILLTVACTRAEWGLIRILPYKVHLMADAGLGILLMLAPVLLGFVHDAAARNTFLVLGAAMIGASTVLSRPEEMPGPNKVVGETFGT